MESLFLLFLFPLIVPALLYPSLHFGMPFSQYITHQGPQYLIMLGEKNLSSGLPFGRKRTCHSLKVQLLVSHPVLLQDVPNQHASTFSRKGSENRANLKRNIVISLGGELLFSPPAAGSGRQMMD